MTFTYTPGGSDNLNRIRFWIQDTNVNRQLLQDEEIRDVLVQEGSPLRAAIVCCETVAINFAAMVTIAVTGQISKSYSDLQGHYSALAQTLRHRMARNTGLIYSGGQSIADKLANQQNTDLPQPKFYVEMMVEPGTDGNSQFPYPEPPIFW